VGVSKEVTSVDNHDDYIHKLADELASNYERDLKNAIEGKWMKNPKSCKFCDGTGIRKICYSCNGKGVKHCNYCQGKKHISGKVCLYCEGKGFETCTTCQGKGKNIECSHSIY
jgi:DnaJ-class molecular chaperone